MTEEIEDDHTTLKKKNNQTPLVFYCRIGESYLISFKKNESIIFLYRSWPLSLQGYRSDTFSSHGPSVYQSGHQSSRFNQRNANMDSCFGCSLILVNFLH